MDKNTEEKKISRHTWIGDEEEAAAVSGGRELRRTIYSEQPEAGTGINDARTRLVEKQKKPYSGFITDEELKAGSEIIRIEDRKTLVMDRPARLKDAVKPAPEKKSRTRTIKIADPKKFRRLIAILAVFAVLVIFEISYFVMKAGAASLPAKTESIKAQTETLEAENAELKKESAGYGDYEDVKEQKESWERLRDKLAE